MMITEVLIRTTQQNLEAQIITIKTFWMPLEVRQLGKLKLVSKGTEWP